MHDWCVVTRGWGACRFATILVEKSSVYAQTKIVCGVCVRDANGKWLDGVCVCVCVCVGGWDHAYGCVGGECGTLLMHVW